MNTIQEVFDYVASHLIKQGKQSLVEGSYPQLQHWMFVGLMVHRVQSVVLF